MRFDSGRILFVACLVQCCAHAAEHGPAWSGYDKKVTWTSRRPMVERLRGGEAHIATRERRGDVEVQKKGQQCKVVMNQEYVVRKS